MENTKVCSKCGRELPLSEFNKCKSRKDGLQPYCKECNKHYHKQYRANNAEAIKQYNKQWRVDNADAIKQYSKQWYADNAEAKKQYSKQWRADNAEARKQYSKQWRVDNADAIKQYNKEYYATIEGYARTIRNGNLRADRQQGRIGANEDPLPPLEYYIWALQQLDFYDKKQYHWSEMGLDRIDNSKPHTIDNVVPCTTEHNVKRHTMPFEEFCELIQKR